MELTDSSDELRVSTTKPAETRSPLGIDLNEIPSPSLHETLPAVSDAIAVVRNFHDNLTPAAGDAVGVPGDERGSGCAACGRPDVRGHVVVCDGCERGFHLSCAGMRGRQAGSLDEWICGDCVSNGEKSKRWPLGMSSSSSSSGSRRSGVRLLDINASPPSDGEGEGSEELQDSRKHIPGGNSFGGNPFGAPVTYSQLFYAGNGFGFHKASGILTHTVKLGFGDILHRAQTMGRSFEEVNFGFPLGSLRSSNDTAIRVPSRNPSDIFLQDLREFISEKHGTLEEGWHVEFKQSVDSCEPYAVYCAPDGKTFESKSEVACYLGLMSNCNSIEADARSDGSASLQKGSYLPKRRKSTRLSVANGFADNKETLMSGFHKDLSFDVQSLEICPSKFGNNVTVAGSGPEENGGTASQQLNDGFPVQFEDFYVLSVGKIDVRPSYHDVRHIWPVGYRSCWHDKITGSLFLCDVSDGGDSGPVFKVRRYSCSALPIPIGSTILFRPNIGHSDGQIEETEDMISFNMDCDEAGSIQMILSDPCPPMENDIMSCLGSNPIEPLYVQSSNMVAIEASSLHDRSGNIISGNFGLKDEIGEFSEEGRSSSLVWRKVCQKLIDACCEIHRRTGTPKLFCKHFDNRTGLPYGDVMHGKSKVGFTSLARFCSLSGYVNITSVIQVHNEFETLSEVLAKWLVQDRYGLDVEFVQEIIEQLPGVLACSRYEFLNNRSNCSRSLTVGNGLLLVKAKSGVQGQEETLDGLFKGCKRARMQMVEDPVMDDRCPPLGKPLGSRLPAELVGDVLQVWEFFGRYYEILGLKEPLSFEELEEELISPWLDGLNVLEKFETENQESQGITHGCGGINGHILSSSSEFGPAVSKENPHAFIQMETGAMKEAAQARLASITYSRCTGVALTKAHNSLLKVLVTELQSKVAVVVDPNFDGGELKSRRGKKKDAEISIPAKRTKLNMLPINELTWPELARRYILAVLTMDGNLDSTEITTRESGKVFRCLQGDGGVLCGSLTGVAGMEADALLLAEATKRVFNSLNKENDVLTIEEEGSDAIAACERIAVNDGNVPEWAQLLEPVRKLPTNVGTRIRKCVYDALEKGPPEWAKKILEHSISKEVYKGNASGPTKKAVLSVLAKACGEGLQQKPEKERKRKSVVCISDLIMKQCRIVLRRAAAADDAKVFCNLLGRKLMNSSDNDDEGLLGSPAMVSRPLDFRTIDLRLSVGAYGGSHEAFLEDVRELWNNVRTAYGDQPDLVELAETLSCNFESLYEKEVVTLVKKLLEYAKSECLTAETRKEIDGILVSTSEIPKAPWDEGVCKVCGIDKDDDSVLLCDTCDAEYHTYCLNPPLARIPEGNWYCPSCVAGKRMIQDASERTRFIGRRRGKKYQGECTRLYLEALTNLTAVMEAKEYWECNVNERTVLLKFLCDELLNSAMIRQHLEQCAETSAELQQKLRSISLEWKNLKFKEEILAARAAKVDTGLLDAIGEVGMVEGLATAPSNHCRSMEQMHTLSDRPNHFSVSSDLSQQDGGHKHPSVNCSKKNYTRNDQVVKPIDTEDVHAVVDGSLVPDSLFSHMDSRKNDKSCRPDDLPSSNLLQQEIDGSDRDTSFQGNMQEYMGRDVSSLLPSDPQGLCLTADMKNTLAAECVPPMTVNESPSYNFELSSVKNDIALLQDSITKVESQLLKQSVRREFLGSDSAGRLYWVSAKPGRHPWVIVDGSMALKLKRKMTDDRNTVDNSSFGTGKVLTLRGSKAPRSLVCGQNDAMHICSPWVSYQSDAEIEELIGWLKDKDPKERELKESILHWRKLRFLDCQQTRNQDQDEPQMSFSGSTNSEKTLSSNSLFTKAASLLEKKYGPCFDPETSDILRKRGRKSKVTNEGKMYRCECLEPIWPSRHHCLSCHRTFFTDVELEGHNDGRCSSGLPAPEKCKENNDPLKGKGIMRSENIREECIGDVDMVDASKSGCSELSSRLIKFQNEGLVCPYNIEEISSKFVTNNSLKELVQEIGLIGSNGIPSFVPSLSPYLSDSTLMLVSQKDIGVQGNEPKAVENNAGCVTSDASLRGCAANEIGDTFRADRPAMGCVEQKDRKPSKSRAPDMDVGHCCVVPQSSLRPLVGKISQILKRLKINLLDMDAALPEEALRPSKAHSEKRWAWRRFVKTAQTIFEMVQATIIFEDMIKTEYLRNGWWYWSSLSAAAKISTVSSLALRIYSLDAVIVYEKISSMDLDPSENPKPNSKSDQKPIPSSDPAEKSKVSRKSSKRRKESEG